MAKANSTQPRVVGTIRRMPNGKLAVFRVSRPCPHRRGHNGHAGEVWEIYSHDLPTLNGKADTAANSRIRVHKRNGRTRHIAAK